MVSEIEQQIDISHQWIFKFDLQHWRQYLPPGWSSSGPLQLVLEKLLHSPVIPLWAAENPIATEWAALQAAWWDMHFQGQKMDEFLTASYNTEEEIKTALKFIPQTNLDDKMEKVNTTLLRECTVNTHLPLEITASVKSHVKSHSNRIQDYKAKVRYINEKKQDRGITLHRNSQTETQTEENIRMFTGNNHVTYPQWKKEAMAILGSSGMLREFWHTTILKRVGPPAVHKITHEAISEKSVSKIMDDLELHYGRSDVVISLLTDLHERAGPIPDPQLEPRSCHKVLALHSEILSGMSEFIQSSSDQDRHKNLYNPFVCKTLFKLIPQSVHFNNPIFRTSLESAKQNMRHGKNG